MLSSLHFISGLPRSGSTLLSALLRQNPRFYASITGPAGTLFNAMLTAASQKNETAIFINEKTRERLLMSVFESVYAEVGSGKVIFDTNRMWTTKLPALVRLFPQCKMICCIRNPAWIIDSIELLTSRNAVDLSAIFNYDVTGTVYSRVDGLCGANGLLGFSISALREAIYGEHSDRLLLLRYDSLVANPTATLAAIYDFLGEPLFPHDPKNVAQVEDAIEFDRRLGTPGLHSVAKEVKL